MDSFKEERIASLNQVLQRSRARRGHDHNRTNPWVDEEFIILNGFQLCYATILNARRRPVITRVFLPGGHSVTLDELDEMAHGECRYPETIRWPA